MTASALLWTSLISFALTAILMLAHRALRSFSRYDLEEICRRRGTPDRFGEVLREHDRVSLGLETLSAFTVSAAVVAGGFWASMPDDGQSTHSAWEFLASTAVLALLLALVRTWAPWAGARLFAEGLLARTWPVWKAMAALMAPILWAARVTDALLHRIAGRQPRQVDDQDIEEEIRAIVTEGYREGLLEDDAREMIEGVIDLGDACVSQIMTPRTDMHVVQADTPWDQAIADVVAAGHTRIPVYDKTRDDVIGILYSKDLLPELANKPPQERRSLRQIARKPLFVPETKAVDDLLEMFQQLRTHIAVVLDEYGGVSGLVTIEDVLEEIVGEIDDEYDPESIEEIEVVDDRTCIALGRTHIDEINHAMRLQLPEDGDFDTIAGLVFSELGRVPQAGESIVWQNAVRIEVLEATKRRIDRVRIERTVGDQREIA